MLFMGNKNGRIVRIKSATACAVTYQDMKYGTVFTVGREMFERCDISAVTDNSPDEG